MSGWVDIHAHVLPGVDDGPGTWEEALALLKMLEADGVATVIATPHVAPGYLWPYAAEKVREKIEQLNQAAQQVGLAIQVLAGGEIYLAPEVVEEAEQHRLPTLGETSKLLVEFPREDLPWWADEVFFKLQRLGYGLILAHPELNRKLRHHPEILEGYVEQGIQLQVDAASLVGVWGEHVQFCALQLMQKGWCHFIASDAHSLARPPLMKQAMACLKATLTERDCSMLFTGAFLK